MNMFGVSAILAPNVFSNLHIDLQPCYRVDFRDLLARVAGGIAEVVEVSTIVDIFS
jgi:hypothetical protein